ncbi:unnamed protein product, partial [Iphiclides podalirius]
MKPRTTSNLPSHSEDRPVSLPGTSCDYNGRITACHPGTDGINRVADVRTANGVIRRPLHKIYHHRIIINTNDRRLLKDVLSTPGGMLTR